MNLQRCLLVGGTHRNAVGDLVSARDDITEIALLARESPLSLRGCAFVAELTSDEAAPDPQPFRIVLHGPPGEVTLLDARVTFGPPHEGLRAARVTVGLDNLAIPQEGTYSFQLTAEGKSVGLFTLVAGRAEGRARARFGAFLQDQQGIAGTERYLSARLPFALFSARDAFAGYHVVRIQQREGDNFEVDALEMELSPGAEPLRSAYDFRVAVHKAYDQYAKQTFGGQLPSGGSVTMSNNIVVTEQIVEFDLPTEPGSTAW